MHCFDENLLSGNRREGRALNGWDTTLLLLLLSNELAWNETDLGFYILRNHTHTQLHGRTYVYAPI